MKSDKKTMICGLVITLVLLGTVSNISANPLIVDIKSVKISYQIIGLDDIYEYFILLYSSPDRYQIIKPDFGLFTFSGSLCRSLYLIKINDFNGSQIGTTEDSIRNYFGNNSKLIKTNVGLSSIFNTVIHDTPLDSISVVLHVSSQNNTFISFHCESVLYGSTDGTFSDGNLVPQDASGKIVISSDTLATPLPQLPTSPQSLPVQLWLLIVSLVAGVSIALLLILRHRRGTKQ